MQVIMSKVMITVNLTELDFVVVIQYNVVYIKIFIPVSCDICMDSMHFMISIVKHKYFYRHMQMYPAVVASVTTE